MTVEKRDLYRECNDQPDVSVEDFQLQFCSRCVRPDCTRSQYGKSKFDHRVTTWESRLFIDVPRMNPEDPRFESFQAKRFREIDMTEVPNVQGGVQDWVDPRDLDEPKTYEIPETKRIETEAIRDRRGRTLEGKKNDVRPDQPVLDPWEPKKQPPSNEKIVKPGAKIKLGG